jgi:hypothetical protein
MSKALASRGKSMFTGTRMGRREGAHNALAPYYKRLKLAGGKTSFIIQLWSPAV